MAGHDLARAVAEARAAAFEALPVEALRAVLPERFTDVDDDALTRAYEAASAPAAGFTAEANGRFVRWGASVVRALGDGSLPPRSAPPYLLRRLGSHLLRDAWDPRPLRALLTPVWREAHEAVLGDDDAFLCDVARLEARCRALDEAASEGAPPRWIGVRWFCALALASARQARGRVVPLEVAVALLRGGAWTEMQAAGEALRCLRASTPEALRSLAASLSPGPTTWLFERLLGRGEQALDAIAAIVPHLPAATRGDAAVRALRLGATSRRPNGLLEAARAVLPSLDPTARARVAGACVDAASRLEQAHLRWDVFEWLAPHLSDDDAVRALRGVEGPDPNAATAIAALVARRPPPLAQEALAAYARLDPYSPARAAVIDAIAPTVTAETLPQVLRAARTGEGEPDSGELGALRSLVSFADPALLPLILERVERLGEYAALALEDALLARLHPDEPSRCVDFMARCVVSPESRALLFARLAAASSDARRPAVVALSLEALRAIEGPPRWMLAAVAKVASGAERAALIARALETPGDAYSGLQRVSEWASLLDVVEPERRPELMRRAWGDVRELTQAHAAVHAFRALRPYAGAERRALASRCVDVLRATAPLEVTDECVLDLLQTCGDDLPVDVDETVLTALAARDADPGRAPFAWANRPLVEAVLPFVKPERVELARAVLLRRFGGSLDLDDAALAALPPHARTLASPPPPAPREAPPPPPVPPASARWLAATRLGDDEARSLALCSILDGGSLATPDDRAAACAAARRASLAAVNPVVRARGLARLVCRAPTWERDALVAQVVAAVACALRADDASVRQRALERGGAPRWERLPAESLDHALDALVPLLTRDEMARLCAAVYQTAPWAEDRLDPLLALALFAEHMSEAQVERCLAAPPTWFDRRGGLRALGALAVRVPRERLIAALGTVRSQTPNRATALAAHANAALARAARGARWPIEDVDALGGTPDRVRALLRRLRADRGDDDARGALAAETVRLAALLEAPDGVPLLRGAMEALTGAHRAALARRVAAHLCSGEARQRYDLIPIALPHLTDPERSEVIPRIRAAAGAERRGVEGTLFDFVSAPEAAAYIDALLAGEEAAWSLPEALIFIARRMTPPQARRALDRVWADAGSFAAHLYWLAPALAADDLRRALERSTELGSPPQPRWFGDAGPRAARSAADRVAATALLASAARGGRGEALADIRWLVALAEGEALRDVVDAVDAVGELWP